jgi:hypothetical protein
MTKFVATAKAKPLFVTGTTSGSLDGANRRSYFLARVRIHIQYLEPEGSLEL